MAAVLAVLTSPTSSSLLVCGVVIAISVFVYNVTARQSEPPPLEVYEATNRFPEDSPAVASLLTTGFVVTPHAAVATVLDLAARDWLSIEELDDDVAVITSHRGMAGDPLSPHEQQILNHFHRVTAGTVTGVSGAGIEVAGLRIRRRWWRRFQRSVAASSRAAGYSTRRWDVVALVAPFGTWILGAWLWWLSARNGEDDAIDESLFSRSLSVVLALILLWQLARLIDVATSHAQRPTSAGLERAQVWLRARLALESDRIGQRSSVTARDGDRRLAYAAAMGLAESASHEVPVVPEDSHRAWSDATGSWRVVRVRYPIRPAYGRHPGFVFLLGAALGVGSWLLQRFLLDVARGDGLQSLAEDFPDQADLIRDVGLVLAAIVTLPLVFAAWMVLAGLIDSVLSVERRGLVVRARRPERIVPLPRLLGRFFSRDRFSLYVAVDDGSSPIVTAWLANERTAVPQGARARVVASPILGYIRRSEPIGTMERPRR
ncbi:MAG: DUF2207 domain-containing protein [Actinomycetota bacterium]|nr:DUF2207 domain-containing protein [Actinomycetota bacterium]